MYDFVPINYLQTSQFFKHNLKYKKNFIDPHIKLWSEITDIIILGRDY